MFLLLVRGWVCGKKMGMALPGLGRGEQDGSPGEFESQENFRRRFQRDSFLFSLAAVGLAGWAALLFGEGLKLPGLLMLCAASLCVLGAGLALGLGDEA